MKKILPIVILVIGLNFASYQSSSADLFVEWSSVNEGMAGSISVSHTATINSGELSVTTGFSADDPAFISSYAALIPALTFGAPPEGANVSSTFTFSSTLPVGSRLLLFDIDISDERFFVSEAGSPLTLFEQLETTNGEMSEFPIYNALTGELSRHPQANGNEWEASVFDISGLNSFDVQFFRSATPFTSATRLAIYTVPEPGTALLCCLFAAIAFTHSRSRRFPVSLST